MMISSSAGSVPAGSATTIVSDVTTIDEVRRYWEQHIHDLEITRHPVGSRGFFDDLDQYHFEKLHHLLRLVDFNGYRGQAVLEVGCGAGVDLARFAKGGAVVTGVDLTESAIALARANFAQQGLTADLRVANGEALPFADGTFDLATCQTVLIHLPDPSLALREMMRVVRPGGLVLAVEPCNMASMGVFSSVTDSFPTDLIAANPSLTADETAKPTKEAAIALSLYQLLREAAQAAEEHETRPSAWRLRARQEGVRE